MNKKFFSSFLALSMLLMSALPCSADVQSTETSFTADNTMLSFLDEMEMNIE